MSTVKQILHRKTSTDSYDTIYLQSSADMIKTSDNSNVQAVLNTHGNDINDLKTSVSSGKASIASAITDKGVSTSSTASFATMSSNIRAIATGTPAWLIVTTSPGTTVTITNTDSGETHTGVASTNTISFDISSIGVWNITVNKDGTSDSGSVTVTNETGVALYPAPAWVVECKNKAVGGIVNHSGYGWIIVHKTDTAATLGLRYWYTDTKFDNQIPYKGSIIANLCATFENNLSTETKQWLNSVTVNEVTAKVFIPSKDQCNGGFSHYETPNNRIFKIGSTAKYWWTSTGSTTGVYAVSTAGYFPTTYSPSESYGFRPHMEVRLP